MNETLVLLLVALVLLQVKHFLFDFVFQTPYQFRNKGIYGHPGGLLHAGLHAFGSLPALFVLQGANTALLAGIVAAEFVVHYHVDWLKERVTRTHGWTSEDAGFWFALGADQLAHHLTYTAILVVLATY